MLNTRRFDAILPGFALAVIGGVPSYLRLGVLLGAVGWATILLVGKP